MAPYETPPRAPKAKVGPVPIPPALDKPKPELKRSILTRLSYSSAAKKRFF